MHFRKGMKIAISAILKPIKHSLGLLVSHYIELDCGKIKTAAICFQSNHRLPGLLELLDFEDSS